MPTTKTTNDINMWKVCTIALAILLLILIGDGLYKDYLMDKNLPISNRQPSLEQQICASISGTPAWFQNGSIIGYGVQPINVSDLINNKILYVYNSDCGYCKKQIEYFKSDWEVYKKSGYTINCKSP